MRFARIVFTVAGVWGVVVLAPLYWLVDLTGTSLRSADRLPAVLLRVSVGGHGVANRLSRHRVEPGAVAAADGSGRNREARLRSDCGRFARPGTPVIERHTRHGAGLVIGDPLCYRANKDSVNRAAQEQRRTESADEEITDDGIAEL